jgi:hypothetical protein
MTLPGRREMTTAPTLTKAKEGRLNRNHPTLSAADNSSSPTTNRTKTRVRLTAASSQALQPSHGTARLLLTSLLMVESVRYDRLGSVTTAAIVASTVPVTAADGIEHGDFTAPM